MSMWQQFVKGNIEKKVLPGSDLHNIYTNHEYNSDLSQSSHCNVNYDEQGRSYVNTGLNEYDKENEEYNEVLSFISLLFNNIPYIDLIHVKLILILYFNVFCSYMLFHFVMLTFYFIF